MMFIPIRVAAPHSNPAKVHRRTGAAALLLGLSLATCAEPPGSLVIVQNQLPTLSEDERSCVISAEVTGNYNPSGVFDVDLDRPYPYITYPLVKNRLPSRISAGVERNAVLMTEFRVSIKAPAGVDPGWPAGCRGEFGVDSVAHMDPGTSRATSIPTFQTCHVQRIRELMEAGAIPTDLSQPVFFVAELTAVADRNGSQERSRPFPFGVQVCAGCLQALFPLTPACADTPKPNPLPGNPCNIAQDGPKVLCCIDPGGALICPAPDL